ncbi:hypothetical protein SGLAM104S_01316 [Streptomyces glaucescens]
MPGRQMGPLVREQRAALGGPETREQTRGDDNAARPVAGAAGQGVGVRRVVGQDGDPGAGKAGERPVGAAPYGPVPPQQPAAGHRDGQQRGDGRFPAISSCGTAARTSGSDHPSGNGLPGSCAMPTTISRPRQTVLHSAITPATPVSSRVAARGCRCCSASRAIGRAVKGRTSGRKTDAHAASAFAFARFFRVVPVRLRRDITLARSSRSRSSRSSSASSPVTKLASTASRSLSASSTLRILRAASPASSAAGVQAKTASRSRVTAPLTMSRVRIVTTVV